MKKLLFRIWSFSILSGCAGANAAAAAGLYALHLNNPASPIEGAVAFLLMAIFCKIFAVLNFYLIYKRLKELDFPDQPTLKEHVKSDKPPKEQRCPPHKWGINPHNEKRQCEWCRRRPDLQ